MKESLYIRIIEFGLKHPDGFTVKEVIGNKNLNLQEWEKSVIRVHLANAHTNYHQTQVLNHNSNIESMFLEIKEGSYGASGTYIINFDAEFKYIDYQELKFARENARSARNFSIVAIIISMLSILTAILIPLLVTQTVKIDPLQINDIKEGVNKK